MAQKNKFTWKGRNEKSTRLRFNNVTPVFHSRLLQETEIKCGCGRRLELDSEMYVFRVEHKNGNWKSHVHFGASCGREVIELSNQINGTSYRNIYFMDTLNVRDEETVVKSYGLRNHEIHNDPQRYTKFNKTYLVSIFILCQTWNQPFPYGPLAEVVDAIHNNPETDCHLQLAFFNSILKKDKRTLARMFEEYRRQRGDSFRNVDLTILDDFIVRELKQASRIL